MGKLFIYSFKNFPYEEHLYKGIGFRFHNLKKDIEKFNDLISRQNPNVIIGIAKSSGNASRFETKAVNIFNKAKKVDSTGVSSYSIDFPIGGYKQIKLNNKFTDSFCNWTMYKISQSIEGKIIKLQFVHIIEEDLPVLNDYLGSLFFE